MYVKDPNNISYSRNSPQGPRGFISQLNDNFRTYYFETNCPTLGTVSGAYNIRFDYGSRDKPINGRILFLNKGNY